MSVGRLGWWCEGSGTQGKEEWARGMVRRNWGWGSSFLGPGLASVIGGFLCGDRLWVRVRLLPKVFAQKVGASEAPAAVSASPETKA